MEEQKLTAEFVAVEIKKKDVIGKRRTWRGGERREMREGRKNKKKEEEFRGKKREESKARSKEGASRKMGLVNL